jgi:hypothetical protein
MMISMKRIFWATILLLQASYLLSSSILYAQENTALDSTHWGNQVRFKLIGGAAANQHWVNFADLSNYVVFAPRDEFNPGPPSFSNALAFGWWGGLGVELPLASTLSLGFTANAQSHNVLLTTIEQTRIGASNGTSIDAQIQHTYDIRLLTAGLDAMLGWRPFESAGLSICAGMRGAWMLEGRVLQQEELLEPRFGGFTRQGDRTRNVRQGNIANGQQIQVHALGGLRYDIAIPLQGAWFLISPEVQVGYPLTRITTTESWQLAFLRGGISIGFANRPEVKQPEPVLPPLPPSYNTPTRKQ